MKKRSMVKQTLEQQIRDRLLEKEKQKQRDKEMDEIILKRARDEIEQDKRRKE
jgi:hypothetical protein